MSFSRSLFAFAKKASASAKNQQRLVTTLPRASHFRTSPICLMKHQNLMQRLAPFVPKRIASLHTEGDRRFVELLNDEIKEEEERSVPVSEMSDGWRTSFDGASGKLSRTHDGDHIEVTFSLNGCIPPLQEEDVGQEGVEDQGVATYPEFTVKVSKPGRKQVIELECYFPDDVQNDEPITDDEDSVNLFSIRSVIMYEGELSESTYIIDTDNLEPQVYSYLLSYLADRGVDNQFADEFIGLCTAAEQREYIRSLQKLKDFIGSK